MFLIACQKETVEEKVLICCLYSYVWRELRQFAEHVVILGLMQYVAGTGQATIQLAKRLCFLPEYR